MTSLWSRLHWVQKMILILGIFGFITILSGLAIVNGLSLGWGMVAVGIVLVIICFILAFITEGLEEQK
jgi:peptidoglycan/LPS O-acetylase OafA/YrhL